MVPEKKSNKQLSLFFNFTDTLEQKHLFYILANQIDWSILEKVFTPLYSSNKGRPGKLTRLIVGLLILKHLRNISDESVVEQWSENVYYQYFCGATSFVAGSPCEVSELISSRKRIRESEIELILQESIRVNSKAGEDEQGSIHTTIQEKHITFPIFVFLQRFFSPANSFLIPSINQNTLFKGRL